MTVYLACTVRGDRSTLNIVRHVASRLEAAGHEVLTAHLLDDYVDEAEGDGSNQAVFERDLRWLESCDLLVAEASGSSYGVGFEVGYILGRAATTGQRALVLYEAAREPSVSRMISGNTHPACKVLAYGTTRQIDEFLTAHVAAVQYARRLALGR
ncbi:MAG TPA: nucleoside 2-deoxyribosyltransferase [Vicinamibacterales bacterium]|nr:nucleoside 2-deoxyribosyltransferase [Acidobacteriota bacterium]HOC19052.1 nucleoside 2-deoxyribosyltransferase [Vicinamibacterales bacterium]